MRTGFVDDLHHEHEAPEPAEPQDVTLGMTALLGIFLAVVLVCAVFFGFGYSTGRTLHGSPAPASASLPAPNAANGEAPGNAAALSVAPSLAPVPAPPLAKPSPAASLTEQPASDARADLSKTRLGPALASEAAQAKGEAGAGIMVQIAAVAREADADALAHALRSSGYDAIVRTEPQDALLHVQVGPFATREAARAMRTRLQANGYNAFMKP